MNKRFSIPLAFCLTIITGCDNKDSTNLVADSIDVLIENNIKDDCVYQLLDPANNISFNTVRPYKNSTSDKSDHDNGHYIISIKDKDTKLLGQAKALEKVGLVKTISNYIIKDTESETYYDEAILSSSIDDKNLTLEKIKGQQFQVTSKGKSIIKKIYDSDDIIGLCVARTKIEKMHVSELPNNRLKVIAELSHTPPEPWAEDKDIIEAFGDITESLYENTLTGLAEAYIIKTNNGYILEGGRINTLK